MKTESRAAPTDMHSLILHQKIAVMIAEIESVERQYQGEINDLKAVNGAMAEALKALLPLAEAYLQSAPSHPDNAKLEDARKALEKAGQTL